MKFDRAKKWYFLFNAFPYAIVQSVILRCAVLVIEKNVEKSQINK
jgi:hypothetical protein